MVVCSWEHSSNETLETTANQDNLETSYIHYASGGVSSKTVVADHVCLRRIPEPISSHIVSYIYIYICFLRSTEYINNVSCYRTLQQVPMLSYVFFLHAPFASCLISVFFLSSCPYFSGGVFVVLSYTVR